MSKPAKKILVFLLLTLVFSTFFYFLIINSGSRGNFSIGLMWCPGLAGLITQLIFERSLRGLGWRFKPVKYQFLAYLTPLAYALTAYLLLWLTGLGRFDPQTAQAGISAAYGIPATLPTPVFTVLYFLVIATLVFMIGGLLPALGEEIGWRGLFVPELSKLTSFTNLSLISGLVWAVWHAPVLLFADYNNAALNAGMDCSALPFWSSQ
jgi:membrane protease YdiL (CAAX protease family)